jgi:glycine cleavage system H protein
MPVLGYTRDHEWVRVDDGDVATIGISSYAAEQLGDVVFVDPSEKGRRVKKGEGAAVVESVKAASDVYSPVSGEVVETNGELAENPQIVNQGAESGGWFMKLKMSDKGDLDGLLDHDGYVAYVESL